MTSQQQDQQHIWYTPAACAAMLEGISQGDHWRARCPAHGGENTQALTIREGKDRYGNPMTLLHCFAHQCSIEDMCAAMGIDVRTLFCIHPDYAKATRAAPRAGGPRIARLKALPAPASADAIAQILLEEMIVSDPQFIQECVPARAKMLELATASPAARESFTRALHEAKIYPAHFWETLRAESESRHDAK